MKKQSHLVKPITNKALATLDIRKAMRKKFGRLQFPTAKELDSLGFIPDGISTQSLEIDLAIGRPGIPRGRLTQILGLDGSGKSTLVTHLIAELQRQGGQAVLCDTEGSYEKWRLKLLGVDYDLLEWFRPRSLEEMYQMARTFIELFVPANPTIPLGIFIDSLDGLHADAAMAAEAGESLPMIDARVNGTENPKLVDLAGRYKVALVYCSQLTTKATMGGGGGRWAGPQYETKGGLSPRYRASLRLEVTKGPRAEDKSGIVTRVECIKNKLAPPFRRAEFMLNFAHGIDTYEDLFNSGVALRFITGGAAGRYRMVTRKKGLVKFVRKDWIKLVNDLGGPNIVRQKLTSRAIRLDKLRPYGQESDRPCAESEAEKAPQSGIES